MTLGELVMALPAAILTGDSGVEVTSVEYDSRKVTPGALFAAVRGLSSDGRRFVPQAVAAGAVAVLADGPLFSQPGVPVVTVRDSRRAMSLAAAAVYGFPASRLVMIGLTGTNGKTTTTYLLESMLALAGSSPGVLGTVDTRYAGRNHLATMTTPEGPDLQGLLKSMFDAGVTHVVMEASSHALDQGRVEGCQYDLALFTNLTQDHLDYHGDFETYFQAKKRLFTQYLTGRRLPGGPRAVINTDDPYGRSLAREIDGQVLTYALENQAHVRVAASSATRAGLTARLDTPAGSLDIHSPLIGELNLYNLTAAAAAGLALGLTPELIAAGLASCRGVPGRLQRVGSRDDFLVLVDYAHTPDALTRVLQACRRLNPRRLLTIFGCGGDRDRTKRPIMARAAGEASDLTIVTSDNPRTEDPMFIIGQIETGLEHLALTKYAPETIGADWKQPAYVVAPDRRQAIALACRLMEPGDILLIAGKGHEDYQILGRDKIHFDDREEASAALTTEGKL
jgi:UDP-N-acetylmuramoyl-L-alanyl-D-glutamate--2,6-diaminopimelate ligase